MELDDIIDKLVSVQQRLTTALPARDRLAFAGWDLLAKRASFVIGPRGVGKTSLLLKQAARHGDLLYVSADHPFLDEVSLWSLAEGAFLRGFSGLAIDEVHFARDWSRHLKAIYDAYPGKVLWASDSSSAVLRDSGADLSRRFLQRRLGYLSFREYVHLRDGVVLPAFEPFKAKREEFAAALGAANVLAAFRAYSEEGFRPIFLEGDYSSRVLAIIEKSIHADAPYFVPQIQENHLRLMRAVVSHLALSPVPTVNLDAMSREWGLGKEKLHQLLAVLEHLEVIRIIRHAKDRSRLSKGAKMFLCDPTLYAALGGNRGTQREALVCAMLHEAGHKITASDDEAACDFIVGDFAIEVGGARKKAKNADFVIRDDIEYPSQRAIPLWSLGLAGMTGIS
jgi:hypothetical protein